MKIPSRIKREKLREVIHSATPGPWHDSFCHWGSSGIYSKNEAIPPEQRTTRSSLAGGGDFKRIVSDTLEPDDASAIVAAINELPTILNALDIVENDRLLLARALLLAAERFDCGDNSCVFKANGKGGMRTNGGCRCMGKGSTNEKLEIVNLAMRIVKEVDDEIDERLTKL
jgi:hypothetical protein